MTDAYGTFLVQSQEPTVVMPPRPPVKLGLVRHGPRIVHPPPHMVPVRLFPVAPRVVPPPLDKTAARETVEEDPNELFWQDGEEDPEQQDDVLQERLSELIGEDVATIDPYL